MILAAEFAAGLVAGLTFAAAVVFACLSTKPRVPAGIAAAVALAACLIAAVLGSGS